MPLLEEDHATSALSVRPWRGFSFSGPPSRFGPSNRAPGPLQPGPVLDFSDLISGPRSGSSDASGEAAPGADGAIVTVWGTGLGSSQGASTITANGAPAARVFYWGRPGRPGPPLICGPDCAGRWSFSRSAIWPPMGRAPSP